MGCIGNSKRHGRASLQFSDGTYLCEYCAPKSLGLHRETSESKALAADERRRAREVAHRERVLAVMPPLAQKAVATFVLRLPSDATAEILIDTARVTFLLRMDHPLAAVAQLTGPVIVSPNMRESRLSTDTRAAWTIALPLGEGVAERMLAAMVLGEDERAVVAMPAETAAEPVKTAKRTRKTKKAALAPTGT